MEKRKFYSPVMKIAFVLQKKTMQKYCFSSDRNWCLWISQRPGSADCASRNQPVFNQGRYDDLSGGFDKTSVRISEKLFENIESRIDDAYVCQKREIEYKVSSAGNAPAPSMPQQISVQKKSSLRLPLRRLKDLINRKNETFQQMLLRMISERGMTNAEVYKKANQDKKLFSKIKKDINYQPKKKTAMAFALALELNLDEAKDLLARAGYAFSPSR